MRRHTIMGWPRAWIGALLENAFFKKLHLLRLRQSADHSTRQPADHGRRPQLGILRDDRPKDGQPFVPIQVEFLGGPFDGHVEWIYDRDAMLKHAELALSVNYATQQWLIGQLPDHIDRPRGHAIYQLQLTARGWRYQHLRTIPARCSTY